MALAGCGDSPGAEAISCLNSRTEVPAATDITPEVSLKLIGVDADDRSKTWKRSACCFPSSDHCASPCTGALPCPVLSVSVTVPEQRVLRADVGGLLLFRRASRTRSLLSFCAVVFTGWERRSRSMSPRARAGAPRPCSARARRKRAALADAVDDEVHEDGSVLLVRVLLALFVL